ncbi:MAG: hypothetical protein EPN26_01165 [Rhodospirillales bacterium]|nr:MAG: hypothetical protein EPN26_01165 [Rhodospirillales bacterium]
MILAKNGKPIESIAAPLAANQIEDKKKRLMPEHLPPATISGFSRQALTPAKKRPQAAARK